MSNIQVSNPFFEVQREPMFVTFNGKTMEGTKDALINTETGEIVGEVGKNYKVVTNTEVANVFGEAFSDVDVSISDHLNGNTGRWAREIIFNDDEYNLVVNDNDVCKTKITIFNGYTGKQAVGFTVSAYRLVCSNGMMGWSKELSVSIPHIKDGIIDQIRNQFSQKFEVLWDKARIWDTWSEEGFTKNDFNQFIETRDYLSDKMKDTYKGFYDPIMSEYGEEETRWGAYNVLTAIASHHTQARKGSHLFSNSYKRVEKLTQDIITFTPSKEKGLVTV